MKFTYFDIKGPILLEPKLFQDDRGYFYESFRSNEFNEAVGQPVDFVQENESLSYAIHTIRGLHYQSAPFVQGKLVKCLSGKILDVFVDVRRGSPTFGESLRVELTDENHHQVYVPEGFLHGFVTLTPNARVSYKVTNYYSAKHEGSVKWDSDVLGLDWGVPQGQAIVSEKDAAAIDFSEWETPFTY